MYRIKNENDNGSRNVESHNKWMENEKKWEKNGHVNYRRHEEKTHKYNTRRQRGAG